MEIFSELGVADSVYAVSTPPGNMSHVAWYAGLAGDDERYGREIGRVETWGAGGADPDYIAATACRPANYPWRLGGMIADRSRRGRVLLLGDACCKHPPTGGLGMNGGVQDAYNLGWKVAAMLRGQAGDTLLDTYETERWPVAKNNVDAAMKNAAQHFLIDEALGLSDEHTVEENWARLSVVWDDSPETEVTRVAVNQAIAAQRIGFRHHNIDFGYTYHEGALIDDGSAPVEPLGPVLIYEPSTRPGYPLPHAYVDRDGTPLPIGNLVKHGHFLLIAGEDGSDWIEAAGQLRLVLGLPIRAIRVGLHAGDYIDVRDSWLKNREIDAGGAVLVRPDRYVAFRSRSAVESPLHTL